jgi:Protein of unknown function (DUF2490)
MKPSFINALVIFAYIFSTNAYAQPIEDGRIWLGLSLQGKLADTGLNWSAELQPRWREEGDNLDQLIIRPALFYKLDAKSSVWFGYEKVINHPESKATFDEHRLWQQYSYTFDPINTLTIQNRTRLEERRKEHGKETNYRLRQMLKVSMPLEINPKFSLIVSDELFINFNNTDWGVRSGFDQNRLFMGAGYVFNPTVKLEAGYLNQYVNSNPVDKMNHVLSSTVSFSF